jgi:hypothetical protein
MFDFKNIFSKKLHYEKIEHNIGFKEKRQFFRRKLAKIAENCGRNPCKSLKQFAKLQNNGSQIFIFVPFSRAPF